MAPIHTWSEPVLEQYYVPGKRQTRSCHSQDVEGWVKRKRIYRSVAANNIATILLEITTSIERKQIRRTMVNDGRN